MNETVNLLQATEKQSNTDKTLFGFWVYIMTDCVLFASLFAVYAVLHNSTFGGEGGQTLFSMPNVLAETLILLTSSYTCGLAMLAAHKNKKADVLMWFGITFVLGVAFLCLELTEFRNLANEGNSWRRSGFLSAFFTLVGTHGLHITVGLIWMATLLQKVMRKGLGGSTMKRLQLLSMFWHFLDVVWIFIFTIVYVFGVIPV